MWTMSIDLCFHADTTWPWTKHHEEIITHILTLHQQDANSGSFHLRNGFLNLPLYGWLVEKNKDQFSITEIALDEWNLHQFHLRSIQKDEMSDS